MGYGDCIDYINAYIEMHDTSKPKVKKATQEDIDRFFG